MKPTYILGINAFHGDSSAVLLRDGQLVAAVEEERFRRIKHWAGFPSASIDRVLHVAGISGHDIDHVAVSRDRHANLSRKLLYLLTRRPSRHLVGERLRNANRIGGMPALVGESLGRDGGDLPRIHFVEHHIAHLASAFFVSPFQDAACAAIDGFGDFVSTSMAVGHGNRLEMLQREYFPHSLGVLYSAVTQWLGFPGYGDEFKVMGLAPYGEPRFVGELRKLVTPEHEGRFRLSLEYFRHWNEGAAMEWSGGYPTMERLYSDALIELLGPPRDPLTPVGKREEDVAHSLQVVFEECQAHVLNGLWDKTQNPRLCIAGGCAMNSVANGKIRSRTPFLDVYIQPASGDNGTALGAAYHVWHNVLGGERGFVMGHAYWGPAHDEAAVVTAMPATDDRGRALVAERFNDTAAVAHAAAKCLADGLVVGWYQGKMEWGARALGNRSILADPRRADMRDLINAKIKFRERFRPFAPAVAAEALDRFFVNAVPDPFMVQVYPVREDERSTIPAVTHVDGSGRLQTVDSASNPAFYQLIKEFEKLTGVPMLLNTSFNENEPIVDTPAQALDCFLRTSMDVIVLNNVLVRRRERNAA